MRLVWLALLSEAVVSLATGRYASTFIALGTFGLTLVPMALSRRFRIYIPRSFMAGIVVFLFATLFLGEVGDFYYRYWWWDVVLHGGSALGFGLVGFVAIFMLFQGDRYAAPPWAMGLFAFCFAMSIGALWEIFEYAMDQIFGTNMQKSGLQDTMWDLIVDAGGGLIGALSGVIYLKRDRGAPFAGLIRDFIYRNGKFFTKYRDK
jgi:Predicted membrane protein